MNKNDLVVGRIYEDVATGEPVEFIGESKERGEVYFGPASPESIMCAKVFLSEHVSKHIREIKKTRRVIVELPIGVDEFDKINSYYTPNFITPYSQYTQVDDGVLSNYVTAGILYNNYEDACLAEGAILNCREIPTDHDAAFDRAWETKLCKYFTGRESKTILRETWLAAIDYVMGEKR